MQKNEKQIQRSKHRQARKRLRSIKRDLSGTAILVKVVFLLLQISILLILLYSFVNLFFSSDMEGNIVHIALCVSALLMINAPALLKHKFKIYIPSILQLIAVLLIYAHFVLGEIFRAYDNVFLFDKALHTISGLVFALLGFSMVNMLNKRYDEHRRLSPFFVSLFSFCFSLTISYLWEVFEYGMDTIFGLNMQRWQDGLATGSGINAVSQGTGLKDTMIDMIVMMIGGALISLAGFFSLKTKKDIFSRLLLHDISDYDLARERAIEENNTEMLSAIEDVYNNGNSDLPDIQTDTEEEITEV